MAASGSEEFDRELNPHRDEDERRNAEQVAATLRPEQRAKFRDVMIARTFPGRPGKRRPPDERPQ